MVSSMPFLMITISGLAVVIAYYMGIVATIHWHGNSCMPVNLPFTGMVTDRSA